MEGNRARRSVPGDSISMDTGTVLKEFDEILCIRNLLNEETLRALTKLCGTNPLDNIILEKEIFLNLLLERANLLNRAAINKKSEPKDKNLSPATIRKKKEKKKTKKVTGGSLGQLVRRKSESKEFQFFIDLTDPEFVEKVDITQLPQWPIRRNSAREVLSILRGPGDSSTDTQSYENAASARVISNYPLIPGRPFREGDPICDRYQIKIYADHTILTLADGCNWGHMSRKAAKRATKTLIEVIEKYYTFVTDVRTAGSVLLLAFSKAHERIMESAADALGPGPGKTTLIGGLLTPNPLSSAMDKNDFFFVHVTLGDCKCFHYCPSNGSLKDITFGNRTNISDASDAGGRLGGDHSILDNLAAGACRIQEGDFIIAMSDGVHDNFDPQSRGITPAELEIDSETWEDVKDIKRGAEVKNNYMIEHMLDILNNLPEKTTETIVVALTEASREITSASRDFMEANPKKKLPPDVKQYPGKLDHASCACIMAGAKQLFQNNFLGNPFINTDAVRKHEALREQQLSYRSNEILEFIAESKEEEEDEEEGEGDIPHSAFFWKSPGVSSKSRARNFFSTKNTPH